MEITTKKLKLSQIKLNPDNPRKIGKVEMERLVKSLQDFPEMLELREIIVDENNIILGGNMRYRALKQIGEKECIAKIVTGLTVDQKREFIIKDNSAFGQYDMDALANLWNDLPLVEWGVALPEDWMDGEKAEAKEDDFDAEEAAESITDPITKTGDVWLLGKHRVMCGDSTKADDVERLRGGAMVDLCFTSPPYGQQRDYGTGKVSDWNNLMQGVFKNVPMSAAGQILVNLGLIHSDGEWVPYWDTWIEWMRSQGWRRFGWYVWDQGCGLPGDWNGRFAPSHEFIFHFNKVAQRPSKTVAKHAENVGKRKKGQSTFREKNGSLKDFTSPESSAQPNKIPDSVVRINRQIGKIGEGIDHPAVFSVSFAAFMVQSWPGLVYEPFCGSGTTLIACEQLDRICYGMEIDPVYCDVIVKRWEKLTGKKAVLDERP